MPSEATAKNGSMASAFAAAKKKAEQHTMRAIDSLITAFPDVKISYRAME